MVGALRRLPKAFGQRGVSYPFEPMLQTRYFHDEL